MNATNKAILKQVEHARGALIRLGSQELESHIHVGRLEAALKIISDNVESLVTGEPNRYASLCSTCWRSTMHDDDALSFLCDTCEEVDLQRRVDERKADKATACTCFDKTCAACIKFAKAEQMRTCDECIAVEFGASHGCDKHNRLPWYDNGAC